MNDEIIENDDILAEIRATREAFAAEHNYDIHAMAETLRAMKLPEGAVLITAPVRNVPPSPTDRIVAQIDAR